MNHFTPSVNSSSLVCKFQDSRIKLVSFSYLLKTLFLQKSSIHDKLFPRKTFESHQGNLIQDFPYRKSHLKSTTSLNSCHYCEYYTYLYSFPHTAQQNQRMSVKLLLDFLQQIFYAVYHRDKLHYPLSKYSETWKMGGPAECY